MSLRYEFNNKNINDSNAFISISGCGIVPYSINNGRIMYLLGREAQYTNWSEGNKWADFGGHRDNNESMKQTAVREGYEEIMGLITKEYISKRIKPNNVIESDETVAFLIKIPYKKGLIKQFDNFYNYVLLNYTNKFFVDAVMKKGLFEKDKIAWFSYEDIIELDKTGVLRKSISTCLKQLKEFNSNKLK